MAAHIADDTIGNELVLMEELILGKSPAMNEVRDKLERIACTDVPVLIRGEAGSGKEILARLIHRRYPGETTPFHKVIPAGRDGWRKSASFVAPRENANGNGHHHQSVPGRPACIGSLFFDEIAELNLISQRKLVYLLKDDRLHNGNGQSGFSPSLLRMICSTRHDIKHEMRLGNFREDLFYSVNIVSLDLPPLRSRREDIPALAEYFWGRYRMELGLDVPSPSPRMLEMLQAQAWPGNIRELSSVIKRYVLLGSEGRIAGELAASASQPAAPGPSSKGAVSLKNLARQEAREIERKIIFRTLRETRWNRKLAARALNISYRTLLYKIKEAGLPRKQSVADGEGQN